MKQKHCKVKDVGKILFEINNEIYKKFPKMLGIRDFEYLNIGNCRAMKEKILKSSDTGKYVF